MKEMLSKVGITIVALSTFCLFLYGSYWVAKTVSYQLFYEDMVQDTVREMVKTEALNN